jgi:hypothetical protein
MIGKLPKSEAGKLSDPDRLGLLFHPRYSSRDSVGIHRIPAELLHSSKLEPRNPIRPWRIPIDLPRSSYKEGSWQAKRPSSPQSLTTLPTRLHLATTLRMRALQMEFPCNGLCSDFHQRGLFIGPWGCSTDLAEAVTHQVAVSRPSHVAGRLGWTASTSLALLFSCRHVSMKPWAKVT